MRILVMGAAGFIGSNLVEYLIARDEHDLCGIDIESDKLRNIKGPRFEFRQSDSADEPELVEDAVRAADVVINLIGYANPSVYVTAPLEVVRANYTHSAWIVGLCVKHGKRLIQASTSEVYGKPTSESFVEDETDLRLGPTIFPRWIYACSKQLLERVILAHCDAGDLEATIVRPFNFIGPRLDYLVPAGTKGGPRVFAHFMSALMDSGPMYLVNSGMQRRSFTYIADANSFFQTLLDAPGARNQVFNIGNPDNDTSIRSLASMMLRLYRELTGSEPRCELIDIDGIDFYGPGYEDSTRVPPDISKALSLGWKPVYDLETTLRDSMRQTLADEEARPTVNRRNRWRRFAAASLPGGFPS